MMDRIPAINDADWNRFWDLEKSKRFSRISWSKRRILKTIESFVVPGGWALDAGCGSGFFSRYFCDCGMKTVALDYSQSALKMAQAATGGRAEIIERDLVNSDLSKYPFPRFDLIFSDGLLEHFSSSDQDKIIRNLLSVLSPKGVLITFVPNRWSPWELIRPFFMPGIEEKPFDFKQLIDLNKRHGLEILSQGGVNTFPFAFSPDRLVGPQFGMLLFTISRQSV